MGLVAVTAAGRAAAGRLARAWPGETRSYPGPASTALPRAWAECDALVCFLAAGAVIRLIAPLLDSKHADPAVVCVDEAARYAVALAGGHGMGGNALAARVAEVLGAEPVITTATDSTGIPGLDNLGWPVEGAVAAVSRAILDGDPVRLDSEHTWPLPAFPGNVQPADPPAHGESTGSASAGSPPAGSAGSAGSASAGSASAGNASVSSAVTGGTGGYRILITDQAIALDEQTAVLRPPSLAVGVGASRGVSAGELLGLIDGALTEAGLSAGSVAGLATVDAKAGEPGITEAAARRGWPVTTYPAELLARVEVPNPSVAPLAAVGTPSVAEAAALTSGDDLVVTKRKSAMATVAVARIRPRGRLAIIGLGPGARDLLPPRAAGELRRASIVVGLDQYLDQVRDLLRPGTRVLASRLGGEEARAAAAVQEAAAGHAVALLGSGDAGVYGMASPALAQAGQDIDVVAVPGITASLAAAALLGAPLGHDHVVISLSDLHTPWPAIRRRVRAAADGDFVVIFYNPRSRGRDWQLPAALEILAGQRPGSTPVGIVRNASRPGQRVTLSTLAKLDVTEVDMLSVVIVGCSASQVVAGRLVTPRGYTWAP
jgi:cobalt-precorrin 5A hydrolase / cobalt-factor III methyltransferase / precorrin-3B C17-methyltransferase